MLSLRKMSKVMQSFKLITRLERIFKFKAQNTTKIVITNSRRPRIAVTFSHDVSSSFGIVIPQSALDADRLDALKKGFERMLEVHQKGKVTLDQLMLRLNEREKLTTSLRSIITVMTDIFFILSISTKHIFFR